MQGRIKEKITAGLLALFIGVGPILTAAPKEAAAAGDIQPVPLFINGQKLQTDDQALLTQGRTLVPIRVLMESLGAQVAWEPEQRTVTVTKDTGASVKLWIDNRLVAYDGGAAYDVCDVAPRIISDRTYVPLRLVGNALGIQVAWDNDNRRVLVDTAAVAEKSRFFDISINGVTAGGTVTDSVPLSLNYGGAVPQGAAQVRYLFLDPLTGTGKITARSADAGGTALWVPDLEERGLGILAAAVVDNAGNFLAGAAVNVNLAVEPRVTLQGLSQGQSMTGGITMSTGVNFKATAVEYEFSVLSDGTSSRSAKQDPVLSYTHNPPAGQTGSIMVRTIALDAAGNEYASAPVEIQANVPPADTTPKVTLKSFKGENVGKIPVTLSISRNFDVTNTQYWARNTAGGQTVLLAEKPWGDHSWFPGPDMAGSWDVYVVVTATNGQTYTSNSQTVTVPAQPGIILKGVGPGQVITGEIKLSSMANVPLQEVAYIVSNPFNGSQKTLGTAATAAEEIAWTPETVNEGERKLQAIGKLADGSTVTSEMVTVKIYLGQIYGPQPVVVKDQFINTVTPMALATQKQNGMSAALQVAQAILETGWGQSVPVDKYTGLFSNNLFGIKGSSTAGSVVSNTWEEYYGTTYRIDANFRAYRNIQESWDDHNDLLLRMERYQPYRDVMHHSSSGAYALKRCGYATDSGYPEKLVNIIKQYGLDKLDEQKL